MSSGGDTIPAGSPRAPLGEAPGGGGDGLAPRSRQSVYRGDTLRWHHSGLASIREVDSWHLNGERTKTSTLGVHAVASLFGIVVALHV